MAAAFTAAAGLPTKDCERRPGSPSGIRKEGSKADTVLFVQQLFNRWLEIRGDDIQVVMRTVGQQI